MSAPPARPRAAAWLDYDVERLVDPSQRELRELAREYTPAVLETEYGSLNKISHNKARQARYTYVITDEPEGWSHQTIGQAEAQRLIEAQAAWIHDRGRLLEIRGWIGLGPRAAPVQWLYTLEGANIAGMQQVLAFPRDRAEGDPEGPFDPRFRVVYTPGFHPPVPGGQRILVDLEHGVTYIMGPDYFGESKKAALRMYCDDSFARGGLVLHAGAKEVLLDDDRLTVAILGLSGTGKTTTTFSRQGQGVRPVQDDMVALWPGGELSVTENGCFAKTFGLTLDTEPVIHRGSTSRDAWLENAYQSADGEVDFSKTVLSPTEVADLREVFLATGADPDHLQAYIAGEVRADDVVNEHLVPDDGWDFVVWTPNGRSIIPLSRIDDAADLDDLAPVRDLGILNRDEGPGAITPGIVRFTSPEQAAGYFMLGETSKTSAAGKDRGRTRSPFTQPFFPREHGLQAERFAELLATTPDLGTWLMNTGFVGGSARDVDDREGIAHKVKIRHSSAMLEALFHDAIAWVRDPDFGYDVVDVDDPANADLLALVPVDILRPDRLYERTDRMRTYRDEVAQRHRERRAFLESYDVDPAIIAAVVRD